jgi:hypothetical protein
MTASQSFLMLFSALLALTCVLLAALAYGRTGELLTPWTLFLGMSFIDFYVPAALFFPVGLALPPWLSLLARDVAMPAVLLFTIGAAFFGWGYHRADGMLDSPSGHHTFKPVKWKVALVATGAIVLLFSPLVASVLDAGGLQPYLAGRLVDRFAQPASGTGWIGFAVSLRGALLPVTMAMAGVAFGVRHKWRTLGYALPVLAAAAAATTLSRGSLLTLLLGLAIIEHARLTDLAGVDIERASRTTWRANSRILAACALGVLLFVGYGTARNYVTAEAYAGSATVENAATGELARFVRGEGFIGLLAVMDAYPRDVQFMGGRTILDMLRLPVPRAMWPGKPAWYGIDDITRAMGWPASTQSAVTMPGELYANFAWWGVPLMWLYGWFFGLTRGCRSDPVFRYLYAFIFVPMILPTFWMAFTGFVNQLVPVPVVALSLWLVFSRSDAVPVGALVPGGALEPSVAGLP